MGFRIVSSGSGNAVMRNEWPCKASMKLSVVIPCYNGADVIGYQLDAIAQQSWSDDWEVIVADNGSTDGSRAVVAQYDGRVPNLRVVDASDRRGSAHARNIGVRAATGEGLVFCDADDVVGPGWLAAMGKALSESGFVACRIDSETLNPEWTQIHNNFQCSSLGKLDWYPYLPHAGGGSLGIKRAVYETVRGFDENLRYCEDTDLCCKVQLSGLALHFVPDAVIQCRYRTTYGGLYRQARNWAEASVFLFKRYRVRRNRGLWRWHYYWLQCKAMLIKGLRQKIVDARGRALLVWQLGWQIGLLRGSIKYRIPPPAPE
jgi:GT2 family glycosyltransferase